MGKVKPMQSEAERPLMPYASHAAAGTGRTPIGIILFAASHLLLGGVLMLAAVTMTRQALARPAAVAPVDWLVTALIALLAMPMLVGGVALLLKGSLAWVVSVISFTLLAFFEAMTIAYAIGMTTRYLQQNNPDVQWAGLFAGLAISQGLLCAVVVGYLGSPKARATFGLPPGETPGLVRRLRRIVTVLYLAALAIGPMLSGIRPLFPD